MNISLSDRLLACCGFVAPGDRVADIGCDHGYTGIYLLTNGIAHSVIAADINEQPLQSAMRNSEKYGVRDKMTFYLSDGVLGVPQDFDTLICAGMGADTMISILSAAPWLKDPRYRLILQCQSKRPELRRWLYEQGYHICRETLAQDGKFIYPVSEVFYQPGQSLSPAQCYIPPALLQSAHPLFPAFYRRVLERVQLTLNGLRHAQSPEAAQYETILWELETMEVTAL